MAVAEIVAILSHDARIDRVAALTFLSIGRVAEIADGLAGAGILESGEPLVFAHPVMRAAVYEQIGAARRGLAHATAARTLLQGGDAERAAAHLLLTPAAGRVWAVGALRRAAAAALARGAPDTAVPLLRRALAEGGSDRIEVLLELARAEAITQDPAAVEHAREVATTGETPAQRVRGAFVATDALLGRGQTNEAAELFELVSRDGTAVDGTLEQELAARTLVTAVFDSAVGLDQRLQALNVDDLPGVTAAERVLLALRAMDLATRARPRGEGLRMARRALGHVDLTDPDCGLYPSLRVCSRSPIKSGKPANCSAR